MSDSKFFDGRVRLLAGDAMERLKELPPDSIDSCVTDPPYHLTSIVKRFGAKNAAPAKAGKTGAYARASRGFMGQQWDGGDIAFQPAFWAEVWRVVKPGAHLVAFSGTRTYHRMVCAIEDAGFEIRDQLAWVYGSGFPKSHDVSKGIDKRGGNAHLTQEVGAAIKKAREVRGLTVGACDAKYCRSSTNWSWFEGRSSGLRLPTAVTFAAIAADWPELQQYADLVSAVERELIGTRVSQGGMTRGGCEFGQAISGMGREIDVTLPATEAAKQWEGWGTALKPAHEPIVLARKPLVGTVVENVLAHGTGGLNIGACRVETNENLNGGRYSENKIGDDGNTYGAGINLRSQKDYVQPLGRYPANLLHDGSDEVLAGFPETGASSDAVRVNRVKTQFGFGDGKDEGRLSRGHSDNGGSAARFFYSAKADSDDRLGSGHPTVKPVDLMQWLVRLITPKGGTTLDPFAGTGTTGEAAWREGMRAVLIEREVAYQADIARRMALCLAGPDERARASVKARFGDLPAGPLFGLLNVP